MGFMAIGALAGGSWLMDHGSLQRRCDVVVAAQAQRGRRLREECRMPRRVRIVAGHALTLDCREVSGGLVQFFSNFGMTVYARGQTCLSAGGNRPKGENAYRQEDSSCTCQTGHHGFTLVSFDLSG